MTTPAIGTGTFLDALALELAVTVAADIVRLTDSDTSGMAKRLDALLSTATSVGSGALAETASFVTGQLRPLHFHLRDARAAIAARRKMPREDVISHLLGDGSSPRDILTECVT